MPAPSINVTFVSGIVTVIVPGPEAQTDVATLPRFVTDQSANHTRWVYQLTATKTYQWTVPLTGLSATQKQELQAFFDNTVKGPTTPFDYTHTNGTIFEDVRFVDTSLSWTRNSDNEWDVTIRLELTTEPL